MTRVIVHSKVDPDGILRLAVPLGSGEADREMQVTIESSAPQEAAAIAAASGAEQAINAAAPGSFLSRLSKQGFVGQFDSAPPDLSTNPQHMEGFGR
jgi:hypothetical protein